MALSWKHLFQSAKSDGTDPTQIQPSNWNADHNFLMDTANVLGRATAGNGAIEQIPCTAQGRTFLSCADIAALIAAGIPLFSTGDVKFTLKTAADPGWVMFNDGTIGNDTSGASLASTATALALYALLWNNTFNTWCPIQDSTGALTTRGASNAADFAASKRMPLPRVLGRALAVAGAGSGLTARALGQILGEEAHAQTVSEMAAHTPSGSVTGTVNSVWTGLFTSNTVGGASSQLPNVNTNLAISAAFAGNSIGGGVAANVMQPTSFLNAMVKL